MADWFLATTHTGDVVDPSSYQLPPFRFTLICLFAIVWTEVGMPTISMFYGIIVRMLFMDTKQHHLPHLHIEYQGEKAVFVFRMETCLKVTYQQRNYGCCRPG
jgi:hypothetical protein